ncbi:hypothetical protein [uncultured Psychroserpens sp.]|uniref:hypothetical protein n=1 Tax=uncultured Psychroserpens sp. TaxID=255436 RepID=UPI0026158A0F|nr:hypothetical protein [uncultured Psychroserpens sp.]
MKKIILFLILVSLFSYDSQSQVSKRDLRNIEAWTVSVGVNAVGSLGTRNPFEKLGDFEFNRPLALSVQHRWSRYLSVEQDFTMNRFKITSRIDNGSLPEEFNYFSTNTYVKYFFSDELFPEALWLDLFVGGGLGIFSIDELNTSANLALGGAYWFNSNIGVRLQGVGKFAFNAKDNRFDNNHFQYVLQVMFRL